LINKKYVCVNKINVVREPYSGADIQRSSALIPYEQQKRVLESVRASIDKGEHKVVLLHGVTASGKTEIYLQSIAYCIGKGKRAIVLVPEISLTPQTVERFRSRFGERVAILHSRLSRGNATTSGGR